MTSGMTVFMVAVGGTSLVCFLLMNRGKTARPGARMPVATLLGHWPAATVPARRLGPVFLDRQRKFFVA